MSQMNLPTAVAFNKLKAPDLSPIVGFLKQVHTDALESMSTVREEHQWRKLQGRASLAKELLDLVESSGEIATKLSRPQQG